MVLDVDMDDTATYMKYITGLNDYIRKVLRLFSVGNIDDAQEKVSAIEGKLKKSETSGKPKTNTSGGTQVKNSSNETGKSEQKETPTCTHCKGKGHVAEKC